MYIDLAKKDCNPVDVGDIILARQEQEFHCFIFFVQEDDEDTNIQWLLNIETGNYVRFDMNGNEEAEDIFDYIENNLGYEILEVIPNSEVMLSRKLTE